MKKRMSKRPSMTGTAAIAIALIALIATLGGAAVAGKGKKKKTKLVNTVVTQTVNSPPGQVNDNGNYNILTASQTCPSGTSAISANAFWGGTALIDPQADQEWIVDIKRNGDGYTARGATDLDGSTFTIEVVCQKVK